jgi:hypothetical protein
MIHDRRHDEPASVDEASRREADDPEHLPSALRGSLEQTFGEDLGDVRVHAGAAGEAAVEAHDARALTRGRDIYFDAGEYAPGTRDGDHLIAHETAHVVQHRNGATGEQRKGRVPDGASAEVEADRPADVAVERIYGGPDRRASIAAAPTGEVMRKGKDDHGAPVDRETAEAVTRQIHQILTSGSTRAPTTTYAFALLNLQWAQTGKVGTLEYTGAQRLAFLNVAMAQLRPYLTSLWRDPQWSRWSGRYLLERDLATLRTELNDKKARERVDGVSFGAPTAAADGGEAASADADAKRLKAAIRTHLSTSSKLTGLANEAVNAESVDVATLGKTSGNGRAAGSAAVGLDALNDALGVVAAYIELTDDELVTKLVELRNQPMLARAATRLELIKIGAGLLDSAVGVTSNSIKLIALRLDKPELAARMERLGGDTTIANVASAVTLVHSVCVLLDGASSDQARLDAAVAAGEAGLQLAGMGGPAAALTGAYMLAKVAADLYWTSRRSLSNAYLTEAFKTLAKQSDGLVSASEKLVATGVLLGAETDADQQRSLAALEKDKAIALGGLVGSFITDTQDGKFAAVAANPSAHRTLREKFAPLTSLRGLTEPAAVLDAAATIIDEVAWCFDNASFLFAAEASGDGLAKAEALKRERQEELAWYEELGRDADEDPVDWTVDDGHGL